jgi:hypothetical protein
MSVEGVLGVAALAALLVSLGGLVWFFLTRTRSEGLCGRFVQALGALALAALVADLAQVTAAMGGWIWPEVSFSPGTLALALPLSWLVACGGWSVQGVFELTAKAVTGHRRDTLMDNLPYFAGLTALQMGLVALVVALCWRRPRWRDPAVVCAFALALANGLAGITWPWWGT